MEPFFRAKAVRRLRRVSMEMAENTSRDVAVIWVGRQKAKCQKNQ